MYIFCISILFFILIFILLLWDLSQVVLDSILEKNELQKVHHNLDKGRMTSKIDGNLRRTLDLTLKDSQLIHQQSSYVSLIHLVS